MASTSQAVTLERLRRQSRLGMFEAMPLLAILLRLMSGEIAILGYLVAGLYAVNGRAQAVTALTLSWLFSMLNPDIFPDSGLASIGRYWILLMSVLCLVAHPSRRPLRNASRQVILGTTLFAVFVILHSFLFSRMSDVSLLKATSWTVAIIVLLMCWSQMSWAQRNRTSNQIYWILIAVMIVSLLLTQFTAGYLPGRQLLRGLLGHSQSLGITMAILALWSLVNLIASRKPARLDLLIFPLAVFTIYLTGARTAFLALTLAFLIMVSLGPHLAQRKLLAMLPGLKSRKVQFNGLIFLILLAISAPSLQSEIDSFLTKGYRADNIQEAFKSSRGGLLEEMQRNIDRYPLTGIGFGIASAPNEMRIVRDPIFGLPISAAVEKGVLPVAVIEELGYPGAGLFALWIMMLIIQSARLGAFSLGILCTILALNMGEAILFSIGGMGMLALILATRCSVVNSAGRKDAKH
ncbi:MAG: hypothetical protein O3B72_03535 [Proteobacteria bacterium]|nr:hypothetical protein [Pseudomonadota bacterium]